MWWNNNYQVYKVDTRIAKQTIELGKGVDSGRKAWRVPAEH